MPRNVATTFTYSTRSALTGKLVSDAPSNHVLTVYTNGIGATPANAGSVVVAGLGRCRITLTAAEMNGDTVTLDGDSSTSNVVILPVNPLTGGGDVSLSDDGPVIAISD